MYCRNYPDIAKRYCRYFRDKKCMASSNIICVFKNKDPAPKEKLISASSPTIYRVYQQGTMTKERLEKLIRKHKTIVAIARDLGVSRNIVRIWKKKFNIV